MPVGLAFANALKERPALQLRIADKRHPTLMGTYLAASVFYGALFDRSPVGLAYDAGLDDADARFLQEVAWKTVNAFYRR